MTWAVVASVAASGTSNAVTSGGINTTGADLIVVTTSDYDGVAATSLTDSKSNTWTKLTTRDSAGLTGRNVIYYCYNPIVGSGHTFSLSQSISFPALSAIAFSGSASTPFDVENGATNSSSNTIATGSITPSQNGEMVVAGVNWNDGGSHPGSTVSITASMTIPVQTPPVSGSCFGSAIAYIAQNTAAAINPTWTSTGDALGMAATIASFKGVAAAGGGGPAYRGGGGGRLGLLLWEAAGLC